MKIPTSHRTVLPSKFMKATLACLTVAGLVILGAGTLRLSLNYDDSKLKPVYKILSPIVGGFEEIADRIGKKS